METLRTEELLIPEYLSEEAALTTAGDWVGNTATQIAVTGAGRQYMLGDAVITVLHPEQGNGIDDMNDLSLVLLVEYGGRRLLITGDLTENEEPNLPAIGPVDVLQVAHHGSNGSSSQAFLQKITPDYALISCGKNNDYGHPHADVLSRLQALGAQIYRTDRDGTVVVRVNEGEISVKIENKK
jgi:competence protein ComEC